MDFERELERLFACDDPSAAHARHKEVLLNRLLNENHMRRIPLAEENLEMVAGGAASPNEANVAEMHKWVR